MDVSAIASASGSHAVSGASSAGAPQQKMSSLFDSIDTSGSGTITQSQFDQAFQSKNPPAVFQQQGADAIFAKLDPNGTGSVSKSDFVSTMSQLMSSLRAEGGSQSGTSSSSSSSSSGSSASDSLAASLQALNQIDPSTVPANAQPGTLLNLTA